MERRIHSEPASLFFVETRACPAAIVATVSGGTLNIVGDSGDNGFTIKADAMDPTKFTISSATDTINGDMAFEALGVTNISIKLLDGNDTVNFDGAVPMNIAGSLKILGGDGDNAINAENLTVGNGISITNGYGRDELNFHNLNVDGSIAIKNGDGSSYINIARTTAGMSSILGDIKVTAGSGADEFYLTDTNVSGNVVAKFGTGSETDSNFFEIYNVENTSQSVIGGNISVSGKDGANPAHGIWDYEVLGNVSFSFGKSESLVYFGQYTAHGDVNIHGNLSIKGTSKVDLDIGTFYPAAGLKVGGNFSVTSGAAGDTHFINHLTVDGATKFKLGDGDNSVKIDGSTFEGAFSLTTGDGADDLLIETLDSTTTATTFKSPAVVKLGAGDDDTTLTGNMDDNQLIVVLRHLLIDSGTGADSLTEHLDHESYPIGGSKTYI